MMSFYKHKEFAREISNVAAERIIVWSSFDTRI